MSEPRLRAKSIELGGGLTEPGYEYVLLEDALEEIAAICAECETAYDEKVRQFARAERDIRAEYEAKLAALREAAALVLGIAQRQLLNPRGEPYFPEPNGALYQADKRAIETLRAALAATPAEEEEGRTLVCERNESAASAHGHTDECYR